MKHTSYLIVDQWLLIPNIIFDVHFRKIYQNASILMRYELAKFLNFLFIQIDIFPLNTNRGNKFMVADAGWIQFLKSWSHEQYAIYIVNNVIYDFYQHI